MEQLETGRVEYTERAFDQDAQERMGSQIENALVELITNSDDSYSTLKTEGQVRVEVERHRRQPTIIRVKDRAAGMSLEEMGQRLLKLGGETSGRREGIQVRGSRGRGAKDVAAFGPTMWESINNDRYQWLKLTPSGQYEKPKRSSLATGQDRQRLGIPRGNGTMVTVEVQMERFRVPQHENLKKTLSHHFRLRLIMSDVDRRVTLEDDLLTYRYPEEYYSSQPVLDVNLPIDGDKGAEGHLKVWRHAEQFDEDKRSAERQGGVLVTSGRDVHENTLFRYDRDPYAERFFGILNVPRIAELSDHYDDCLRQGLTPPPANPVPILRVDHSLNPQHPFTKALKAAVEERLRPLVDQERKREQQARATIEDEETQRRLRQLSRAASRFFAQKMAEALGEPVGAASGGTDLSKPFAIIPPTAEIAEKEEKYLTVRLLEEGGNNAPIEVAVTVEGEGIVVSPTKLLLQTAAPGREQKTGTLKVTGMKVNTYNRLVCRCNSYEADAVVQVVEKRPLPAEPPDRFKFERDRYFVVPGKAKRLKLLVPEHADALGATAHVASDRQGIVVRKATVGIRYGDEGYGVGIVVVEGRQLGARGKVKAVLGDMAAETTVHVVTREPKGDFPFDFNPVDDRFDPLRARWEPPDSYNLEIAGKHPSVARYLGPADKDFPGKTSVEYKLLLAEIVADSVCRKLLDEIADKRRDLFGSMTVGDFYTEHHRRFGEFVQVAHKMMLSDAELRSFLLEKDERPE